MKIGQKVGIHAISMDLPWNGGFHGLMGAVCGGSNKLHEYDRCVCYSVAEKG